jgi:TRAP-type mannitol/chloroaromatic compound transport system permease small subunit
MAQAEGGPFQSRPAKIGGSQILGVQSEQAAAGPGQRWHPLTVQERQQGDAVGALGGAFAQQRKAHINVDILYLSVPPRWKHVFNLLSYLLGGFFLVIVCHLGWGKMEEAIEFDYRRQSEWAPSMIHFWVMIVAASAVFLLQLSSDFLQNLWQLMTGQPLLDDRETGGSA